MFSISQLDTRSNKYSTPFIESARTAVVFIRFPLVPKLFQYPVLKSLDREALLR